MELHASCAARDGAGVLLLGPSGSGKSDLLLRLLDHGFDLVADDRVVVESGVARARPAGAGLLEVRGLGIHRLPCIPEARLRLLVRLKAFRDLPARLPEAWIPGRAIDPSGLDLPSIEVDATAGSAATRVRLALDCLVGRVDQIAGFLAA